MNPIRLGVIGLGRAFMATAPALLAHPTIQIAGVADPRPEARAKAVADLGVATYDNAEALCRDDAIDAVYIATPHQLHADHVELCARHGKHVLVEKPMALTLGECDRMISAVERAGVALVIGPTHSFDRPVVAARELIRSGRMGSLRMISAWAFTDFLYRPRRPEELDTAQGGGVIFNQAPHHVDVVRLLGGGQVRSVRSITGAWDSNRPTEAAYSTLLEFESGAAATLVYSGYAHFDTDEFHGWIGAVGNVKSPADHGSARRLLAGVASGDEARLKSETGYGGTLTRSLGPLGAARLPAKRELSAPSDGRAVGNTRTAGGHPHFGVLIASCDRADIRPTPDGLCVYEDTAVNMISIPCDNDETGRAAVLDELTTAITSGTSSLHDGRWGKATLEVCLAMLESSRDRREVRLHHQCPANENNVVPIKGI